MVTARATETSDVDVVVIGGGVNGTGVARDCALRGLRVALFEKNDLAFGASGNSSGMIHGGARYLTYDPDVTATSCRDSGHIQRIAPHLLFRIPFLMPVQKRSGARAMLEALDAFFSVYDKYQPLKRGKPHTRLTADELIKLEPGLSTPAVGGVSFDEWGIDGGRLCVGNAVDAREHGAAIRVHTAVTSIQIEEGCARSVTYKDLLTGESGLIRARIIVNASGAWAPITAGLSGLAQSAAGVRPGKGIHVVLDRRLTNYAIAVNAIDGRQIFMEPWQNVTVVGTTDDDYYGDLDRVVASTDEVRYLMQGVARVFPSVTEARAIGTFAGVRPTLPAWGKYEAKLSREHEIVDHRAHGAARFYSMIGGKLASYRLFAQEMTDRIVRELGARQACQSHVLSLPGGDEPGAPLRLSEDFGLDVITALRLNYRHGSRASRVMEAAGSAPSRLRVLCDCEPVTEAEVRYVVEHEFATDVHDVARRTRLGLGACGGMRCAVRCGRVVASMRGQSPECGVHMGVEFLVAAARRRAPAVGPAQARQEALSLSSVRAELGDDAAEQLGRQRP